MRSLPLLFRSLSLPYACLFINRGPPSFLCFPAPSLRRPVNLPDFTPFGQGPAALSSKLSYRPPHTEQDGILPVWPHHVHPLSGKNPKYLWTTAPCCASPARSAHSCNSFALQGPFPAIKYLFPDQKYFCLFFPGTCILAPFLWEPAVFPDPGIILFDVSRRHLEKLSLKD